MIEISIILDSSVIVSAYNIRDQNHAMGFKIIKDIQEGKYGKDVVISNFIFDETMTALFVKTESKLIPSIVGKHILNSCLIINVTDGILMKSFDLFSKENLLSLTDCTILHMAFTYGIDYIATFDKEMKKQFKNCISD